MRWGRRQVERWLKEPLVGTEKNIRVRGRGQQDGVEKGMEEQERNTIVVGVTTVTKRPDK